MIKKKKLGTRITIAVLAVLAYGILAAGITGMVCLINQSQSDMESAMTQRVSAASNLVSTSLRHYQSLIPTLDGTNAQVERITASDPNIEVIQTRASGSPGISLSSDGYILITGEYSKGTAYIATGTEWLGDILKSMHMSDTTELYLLSSDGSILADVNGTLTQEQLSSCGITGKVRTSGVNGKNRILYDAAIPDTGWNVLVVCDANEFHGNSTKALFILIANVAVCFLLGSFVIRRYVRKIVTPLEAINGKILDMSAGKLSTGAVEVHTGDELQTLAEAVNSMSDYTGVIIRDIKDTAAKIAAEDLTAETTAEYIGDYAPIKEALDGIITGTSSVIRQIEASSAAVADGSATMSSNSTMLSQAATEQAATVEELNASVVEISSNITANADSAAKAKVLADDCRAIVDEGSSKMSDMLRAMEEINETSSKIANIIKAIQDISFQTNILSLNASIEAARAGEAGKGFAVVAGEVGQLAGKTAEAAKNTTELIKTALSAVENGTVMANETAKMLDKIVRETDDTADVIEQIASASKEQADSVKQILVGMDQISTSIQMTSGSSAECAASAKDISDQAQVLHELVQRFRLADPKKRKGTRKNTAPLSPAPETAPATTASAPMPEKQPTTEKKPAAKPEIKPEKPQTAEKKPVAKPEIKPEKQPTAEKKPAAKPTAAPAKTAAEKAPSQVKPEPAPTPRARSIVLDDDKY